MSRPGRYTPDNPFQRATALGKRLRVYVSDDGTRGRWQHPDTPLVYALHADGRWSLETPAAGRSVVHAAGSMTAEAAALHLERARLTDPRRLAAAAMLHHLPEGVPA